MFKQIIQSFKKFYYHSSSQRYLNHLNKKGMQIGKNVIIYAPRTCLIDETRPSLVSIGNNVLINKGFNLLTHDYVSGVFINCGLHFLPSSGKVTIGNNVGFGYNVMVLKGVTIGNNVFIGANSVVNKSIPDNSIATGNPCKVICSLEEYYEKRQTACVDEVLAFAKSIEERFHRAPKPSDFKEEFPLFVSGNQVQDYPEIPIQQQLGPTYETYVKSHKAPFKSFDEFLEVALKN